MPRSAGQVLSQPCKQAGEVGTTSAKALQDSRDGTPAMCQAWGETLSIILFNFGWRIVKKVQPAWAGGGGGDMPGGETT